MRLAPQSRSAGLRCALAVGRTRLLATCVVLLAGGTIALAGCGGDFATSAQRSGRISAVGAESQYADVISQIGGKYVQVSAIESSPNTDPHTFEASPSIARAVASARLIVQNGLGYDSFIEKIESATQSDSRKVIDVGKLLRLADSTRNPHLWYSPRTMPALAAALASALAQIEPAHAAYFRGNAARFERSLRPWRSALSRLRARHPQATAASTEPVGDYMLQAAGVQNLTPASLQADIMNGIDPSPQAVSYQKSLFARHRVDVFVYNRQVTDSLTESFLSDAARDRIPVVGLYETMPRGYHYQSWMLAEVRALERALTSGVSTRSL